MSERQLTACSKPQLWDLLQEASSCPGPEHAFLEGGRDRERAYAAGSLNRWHEIVELILALPSRAACLDIGTSPFTFVLPRFFDQVHTIDYTDAMKSRCEERAIHFHGGGITGQTGKVAIPAPEDRFDCVLFLEIIEHLHLNPVDILRTLHSKLRPGGTLLLSTPNMMCLGNRLRMLSNRKLFLFNYPPFAENEHPQHGHGHDRIYMPGEMQDYFKQTHWSRFRLTYHGLQVCDGPAQSGLRGLLSELIKQPLKAFFPSLRQLMLIQAEK